MADFESQITEYRKDLLSREQQVQSDYDKAVMALSGGALGISMTFFKDVVVKQGIHAETFLLTAWICWGLSVTCTLASFYSSALALRRAIKQTDDRLIYLELAGGKFNLVTKVLNPCAGGLFAVGVGFIVWFISCNIP